MKKRFLPLGFFILIIGFASVLLSATLIDNDKRPKVKNETASEYLSQIRANQTTGKLNPKDVMKVREQVEKSELLKSGNENNYNWYLAGPNNLGGRTRAIMFDNADPDGNIVYAGNVMGGLFKSTNAGASWTKINESTMDLNVSCMTQTSNGDIYVGTGEGFDMKEYTVLKDWGYENGFIGKGIFKSSDGNNFSLIPSTEPVMNGDILEWGFINELAAAPTNNRVYASTNTGLKYTDDGGSTWNLAKTDLDEDLNLVSQDVKVGSDGLVITEVNGLCYVSSDGNPNNFVLHSTDSTYDLPNSDVGRIEFAIAPTDGNIIYALVAGTTGSFNGVFRSDDRGNTWALVGPGGSSDFNLFTYTTTPPDNRGIYSNTITVFPDNPDHILVGGINMWEGIRVQQEGFFNWTMQSDGSIDNVLYEPFVPRFHHVYVFRPGHPDEFFVGCNGGIYDGLINQGLYTYSFSSINKNYIGAQFMTIGVSKLKTHVFGGAQDLGTIEIPGYELQPSDPKRGTDIWTDGIYPDGTDLPNGANGGYVVTSTIYPEARIYSRTPHPAKNGNIETFVRRNENVSGNDFSANMLSDKYASLSAFLSPFLLWESYDNPNTGDSVKFYALKDYPAGSVIWANSNNNNYPFKYTLSSALATGDSIIVPDIVNTKFFIGGDSRVLLSPDIIQFNRVPRWYVISNTSTGFTGTPSCMAYSANANHLFVGTIEGKLYRISNIAYAYDSLRADVNSPYCVISTTNIPVYEPGTSTEISQVITSVAVDPNNANRVIITLGNYGNTAYVMMTTNALDETPEFHSIQGDPNNGGLPQMPAYSSLFEMNPDNHLVFVGTEYGIYVSDNVDAANPTWVSQNKNIGHVPVFMLKQQLIRKENDTVPIGVVDPIMKVYEGNNNYGVIYGASYGRGMIIMDEFQKPVGIFGPSNPVAENAFMSIYPNPANDYINVTFEMENTSKSELKIYDLNGRMIKILSLGQLSKGKQEVKLNVGDLPKGTYMLQLRAGQKSASSKFIIY